MDISPSVDTWRSMVLSTFVGHVPPENIQEVDGTIPLQMTKPMNLLELELCQLHLHPKSQHLETPGISWAAQSLRRNPSETRYPGRRQSVQAPEKRELDGGNGMDMRTRTFFSCLVSSRGFRQKWETWPVVFWLLNIEEP